VNVVASQEELIKQLEAARAKYYKLLAEAIEKKIPGIFEKVAAECSVGTECSTGKTAGLDIGLLPEVEKTRG
jgi:hypothetical protein